MNLNNKKFLTQSQMGDVLEVFVVTLGTKSKGMYVKSF